MIHGYEGTASETSSVVVSSANSESTLSDSESSLTLNASAILAFCSNSTYDHLVETLPMPVPDTPLHKLYKAPSLPLSQFRAVPRLIRQPCWRAGRWKSLT